MTGGPSPLVAIAWAGFQPRTASLAAAFEGDAVFVRGRGPAPVRYLAAAERTWRLLEPRRPARVLVVTPPVPAPLVTWVWCRLRRRPLAIDCHTDTFHAARWRWARPLHRWLLRRSRAALLHTDEARTLVESWAAPALLLPDDVPGPDEAQPRPATSGSTVLVAGSLDRTEPVAEALAAAALLPGVEVRVTGDAGLLPRAVKAAAPPNVTFTGFLPYPAFLGEMLAADAVAALSTDPHIMCRAAFEAIGLGRPLVLSDVGGLRQRFGAAALFTENSANAIARALSRAMAARETLERRSAALAVDLRTQHAHAVERLRAMLAEPVRERVLRITQHAFPDDPIVRRDVLELANRGHQVDVVCASGPGPPEPVLVSQGSVRVHRVPIRHRRGSFLRYAFEYGAFFAAAAAWAGALAVRRRPAVVQVDNLPDLLVFAAAVPRLLGARVVFTMYELTPEMVAGRYRGRAGRGLVRLSRLVEFAATRWADRVIVVSRPCRDVLRSRGLSEERMSVVPNTMSWSDPMPAPAGGGRRGQVLVTHGTLVERYGVHVAIQAMALLGPRWPDLTLRVIGGGEQLPALVRLAHELGVDDRVVFTGVLAWSRALREVGHARLGVVPVLGDGYGRLLLPTKLLEYAWLGIPAVCSRLPAIEDYFPSDAVTYAAPGDPHDLAAGVELLLREPELAGRQARRAQEIARELAWERIRDGYLSALGLVEPDAAAEAGAVGAGPVTATPR